MYLYKYAYAASWTAGKRTCTELNASSLNVNVNVPARHACHVRKTGSIFAFLQSKQPQNSDFAVLGTSDGPVPFLRCKQKMTTNRFSKHIDNIHKTQFISE